MLIGLVGKAGAGKDTVADYLIAAHGFEKLSFAAALKAAVLALNPKVGFGPPIDGSPAQQVFRVADVVARDGWDTAKREIPEVRRLLQVMGTEVGRQILGENVWVGLVARQIEPRKNYVITDVRFPNEVQFVRSLVGTVVQITRPNNPHAIAATHASEQLEVQPDFVLSNDGSLAQLNERTDQLVGWVRYIRGNLRAETTGV